MRLNQDEAEMRFGKRCEGRKPIRDQDGLWVPILVPLDPMNPTRFSYHGYRLQEPSTAAQQDCVKWVPPS